MPNLKLNRKVKRIPHLFFLAFLFLSYSSFSQKNNSIEGDVYAIVVGISKYHYIKPLNYADNDAALFNELLRSGAGGQAKPENIFLLKNDSANAGNFWSAISRISNMPLKKGDRVYIYFAGHGDAVKGLNEYYLLLSDCQPANDGNSYLLSFGAIDMYHLKNRIGLLTGRGVEVILILDACRTNELAGGYASQVFNSSIIQTKVGEITMLATSPGQVSIEDASFGAGHGLFTYNLIDAMSGKADREEGGNNDQLLSLEEIQHWVTKHVRSMSDKFRASQSPVFCCEEKNQETIGIVDSGFGIIWNRLNQLNNTNNSIIIPSSKNQRNNEPVADTSLLALYNKFNEARKQNNLWGDNSANSFYDEMESRFHGEKITEDARYMLASDFINFAQQKINLYLEGKDLLSLEIMREKKDSLDESELLAEQYERLLRTVSEKWTIAGMMVEKAGKLLSSTGDSSFLYKLKPKIYFLMARGYVNEEKENTLSYAQALQYAYATYTSDTTAAYAAECLGLVHAYKHSWAYFIRYNKSEFVFSDRSRFDTALYYFKKAIALAPEWVSPYRSAAREAYGEDWSDKAMLYMRKAILINPEDGNNYIFAGDLLRYVFPNDSSNYYYKLALAKTPASVHSQIYQKIGANFLRSFTPGVKWPRMKRDSIFWYSQKALAIDPNNIEAYLNFARVYELLSKPDSALPYYSKTNDISPGNPYYNNAIYRYYTEHHMPDSILSYSRKLLSLDPKNYGAMYKIAVYYNQKPGYRDSAIAYYQQTLQSNFPYFESRERLAFLLMDKDRNDTTALGYFNYMLDKSPLLWRQYYNIASYYANQGNVGKAIEFLQKAIDRGFRVYKQITTDRYFDPIRNDESFKALVKKYFG